MKLDAIIFDLDGTLLDTLQDLADTMNAILTRLGYPAHGMEEYKQFIGHGFANLASRSLPESARTQSVISQCVREGKAEYDRRWMLNTRAYEGVPELLSRIAEKGVPQAVLSNKPHEFTQKMVSHYLGSWKFAAVIGSRDGFPPKPDPAGALEISAAIGVPPERVLYVGDSGADMETACNAGMYPLGVLWGFRGREELLSRGARLLISRPAEILELI
jgi:phosphoglycolate phosphatase